MGRFCEFPKTFVWGVATSAYQTEGAAAEDGRAPSVWDTFCRRPGAIAMKQTGDVACDHYHRYREDVALMKELGIKAYRFSVSWPRVIPQRGSVNAKGVDFYKRLIDELHRAGIQPWMTLFHWDLPQWAEDEFRGWESRQCAHAFADYATLMAKEVGDRVAGVFTINEFCCFLDKAYQTSDEPFAPAKVTSPKTLYQARHHAVLGHGLAVAAFRAAAKKSPPIGLAENLPAVVPILEREDHIAAAKIALREMSGMYLTPIFEGRYHEAYLESPDAPTFTDADMKVIATPIDLLGMNLYAPTFVRHDPASSRGWSKLPDDPEYPRMHMPWLLIGPSIAYWTPRLASELWKPQAIYITENGCAYPDRLAASGEILDTARAMYVQEHLIHANRATAEGYPLKGYFLWSLMDNFEWAYGYTKRFGICHTNYRTLERTPKLSARFYADVIHRNGLGGEGKRVSPENS